MTLVSIAIVAHNNWPDLELAIESALNQSWKSTEVVVIDNESSDGTEAGILHRFEGRIRYIRQRNTLDGGGYNRGIAESNGDFIQLLDGDDFIAPNKIARQIEVFRARRDADIVYGETRQFQGEAGRPAWSDWDTRPHEDMLATLLDPAGEGAGLVIHSALFRRRVFDRVGPWDETLVGADFDYWLRCAWAGCVFAFSPGAWCFHRRRPQQMSSNTTAMVNRTVKTLEKALRYIDREPYRSMASARLAGLIYGSAMTDLRLSRENAIEALRTARQLAPARIGSIPYALGYTAVSVPGLRHLLKMPGLTTVRRTFGRKLGMLDS
jgi:glycosyltransferase involved in cell wall biosynthesis